MKTKTVSRKILGDFGIYFKMYGGHGYCVYCCSHFGGLCLVLVCVLFVFCASLLQCRRSVYIVPFPRHTHLLFNFPLQTSCIINQKIVVDNLNFT